MGPTMQNWISRRVNIILLGSHLVSDIPVWNGVLAFVPPYMRAAADFMPIRQFTDFIGNKRQGSQIWLFFRFKDAPTASGALLERLVIEFFYCFSDAGI